MSDRLASTGSSETTDGGLGSDRPRSAPGDAPAITAGAEVGRYVLLRPIATGGMGVVYLAFDPELDRNVALKLLLPQRGGQAEDPDTLVGEARALAKLSHTNVIQVYDVGTWGRQVYVALEYVAGRTFDAWLRQSKRSWQEILDVLRDAGRGLAAAHRADIVHLDVKPSNILVGDDGVVRVLDFGLARSVAAPSADAAASDPSAELAAARVVGTIGYIAPEQFLGQLPDARSDQFGFCATAWEALAGARPFPGRTRREYERALLDAVITPPRDAAAPARVFAALRVGLALRPSARFADMDALLHAIDGARTPWTRRPWVVGVGAAAIVGASLAARFGVAAPNPCTPGEDALAGVWEPGRQEAVRTAFEATALPFSAGAWRATHRAITDRTQAWVRVYDENCAATHLRHERPQAAYERTEACLQERHRELESMVALFEHADGDTVEHAATAARALSWPADCLNVMPRDDGGTAADREYAASLAARLAEASAWVQAYRLEPGLEAALAVAADARAAELPALEARAHGAAALAASRLGRVPEALAQLEAAVLAADAAGDDDERAIALIDLVYVSGHLANLPARAHWYFALAEGLLARLDGRQTQRAALLSNRATVYTDEGRYEEALATYRRALAAWMADGDGIDDTLAVAMNNVGGVHLARGEHAAAAVWFAHAYLARVALDGAEHPAVADVLVNQANVLHKLGQPQLALEHNLRALAVLERARGSNDASLRVALNNVAVVLLELDRVRDAQPYLHRALALWLDLDPENPVVGVVLANIAEGDLELGNADRAHDGFSRAHRLLARVLPAGHPYAAHALAGVGRSLLARGDVGGAIPALRVAIDALDRADVEPELRAEPRFALAQALFAAGREPQIARALARQARDGYAEMGAAGRPELDEVEAWLRLH